MLYFDDAGPVVDARGMPAALRQAAVLDLFDTLKDGESFRIVSDDDPAPLERHFGSRAVCPFEWEYLERGPKGWQVRVTRR